MKAIINTGTNYNRLNGKPLEVIKMGDKTVTCRVPKTEDPNYGTRSCFDKEVDFSKDEVTFTHDSLPDRLARRIGENVEANEGIFLEPGEDRLRLRNFRVLDVKIVSEKEYQMLLRPYDGDGARWTKSMPL